MILLNDVLSCMVCSNFEPLGRTNQKNLRLCHQKWIPHSLESRSWSERSNLSLEQKNLISGFSLGVFSTFLNFMFSWLSWDYWFFFRFSLELSVHLRISCLEISVCFDFLEFSIFLLSLVVLFFEFLQISDFLDLIILRLVYFSFFLKPAFIVFKVDFFRLSLEINVHLRIFRLEISVFFDFLGFSIFYFIFLWFFLRVSWN